MARYIDSVCRLCRRAGEKLFLKGTRCNTPKCAIVKRSYAPGQHGQQSRQKLSNYGLQLKEKQKAKWMYGVLERQFRRYFDIASKSKGVTGKVLLQLLERRLDNVIFRLGVGTSRSQSRQIVRHNFIYVNSKRVNIPSYLVKQGESIQIKTNEKTLKKIKDNLEVKKAEMSYNEAIEAGALAFFKEKYPKKVTVYSITELSRSGSEGEEEGLSSSPKVFSKEICAGPHVQRTGELGSFKIMKEESSGAGVRRIKAMIYGQQEEDF